jgi:flagellar biosynthesis GTPase FlhF
MHVRKFEADSLEEALKDIKRELGPDAIILKTITNKGLKGAFKKKRIEITAAISEKNYTKKAQVDHALGEENREQFYNSNSSYVSNMIDNYSGSQTKEVNQNPGMNVSYAKLGLNKPVNSSNAPKELPSVIKSSLDDFLGAKEEENNQKEVEYSNASNRDIDYGQEEQARVQLQTSYQEATQKHNDEMNEQAQEQLTSQKRKIEDLERQLFDLTKHIERLDKKEPQGIFQLRTTLKSLDISDHYIQSITKKATFELSRDELENQEIVFEFALREMLGEVPTAMPLFSSLDSTQTPVVTVLMSETSSGQTSMLQKIGALKEQAILIKNLAPGQEASPSFTDKVFNLDVIYTRSIAEMVSECRRAIESGKSVFIDYKNLESQMNETKKFVDGLRRSFDKVEVLVTLSAINSELYNRKVMNRYKKLSDGLVISHLDLCLNFGALFNIVEGNDSLPFKFFGTGEVIPDDLEAATAERILAGIFQLS